MIYFPELKMSKKLTDVGIRINLMIGYDVFETHGKSF